MSGHGTTLFDKTFPSTWGRPPSGTRRSGGSTSGTSNQKTVQHTKTKAPQRYTYISEVRCAHSRARAQNQPGSICSSICGAPHREQQPCTRDSSAHPQVKTMQQRNRTRPLNHNSAPSLFRTRRTNPGRHISAQLEAPCSIAHVGQAAVVRKIANNQDPELAWSFNDSWLRPVRSMYSLLTEEQAISPSTRPAASERRAEAWSVPASLTPTLASALQIRWTKGELGRR